jgi:glucosamine--fructose-6-phosphate aminotransferase (isomerizing)
MVTSTHLFKEIHEQPAVLQKLLEREEGTARSLAQAIRDRDISYIMIAARGSSDNAARYAQYVFGTMNGFPVALAAPSEFTIYQHPPQFRNALVIGISQSGQSPDIVAVLAEARKQGALTAVITNTPESALAQEGDFVLPLHAGDERSIASTKTYTASLAAIALISSKLSDDSEMWSSLQDLAGMVEKALTIAGHVAEVSVRYRFMSRCIVVGRGYNYATAFELALKLKELTYTIVEPYSSADFLHGPLAMIQEGFPVIVISPSGAVREEMDRFVRGLREHRAEVLIIRDANDKRRETLSLQVPCTVPEWLSPITMAVPAQLLSMFIADMRGYPVDTPRSLHKVTETT